MRYLTMKSFLSTVVLIFTFLFSTSCESSIFDDKDLTVRDILRAIEEGTSISLRLSPTLVYIVKGVGGGDVSSDSHSIDFEIIKFISKSDMEYGIYFYMEECYGDTYKKGWYVFCMNLRFKDTIKIIDFVKPELVYDNPRW